MEAVQRWIVSFSVVLTTAIFASSATVEAQNARTQNFLVHAPNQQLAESVAQNAERFRDELALYWLGQKLPPWSTPCPINVIAGPQLAAQGVTTYNRAPVGNFQMEVVGTPERILDSVLPHEVTHTILATHFGRPLPRWADEGICTTVEHAAERDKHEHKLREFLSTRRGIAMNELFLLTEYPADMLPMYAQGYSVCRFLIEQSGPQPFIRFLEDYFQDPSWTTNVQKHYGYDSLAQLQDNWLGWVAKGGGPVNAFVSARSKSAAAVAVAGGVTDKREGDGVVPAGYNAPAASDMAIGQLQPPRNQLAASTTTASPVGASSNSGSWYLSQRENAIRDNTAPQPQSTPAANTASNPAAVWDGVALANDPNRLAASAPEGGSPAAKSASASIAPPSVAASGRYSVSQPQEEQSYGGSAYRGQFYGGPAQISSSAGATAKLR